MSRLKTSSSTVRISSLPRAVCGEAGGCSLSYSTTSASSANMASWVAARFGPDGLDSSGRASLRSAMWSLRRALGDAGERHVAATRERVGLEDVEVDAREFDELVRRGELREAVALCDGQLLAGID